MPLGNIAGALFFLLLFLAAITSTISMLEAPAAYFMDTNKWSRKKAAWTVAIVAFLFGIPAALSNGASEFFTNMHVNIFGIEKKGFMDIMDYLFGTLFMMVVVLATCLYTGWMMKTSKMVDEIKDGAPGFVNSKILGVAPYKIWTFTIRFICPLIIVLVMLSLLRVIG